MEHAALSNAHALRSTNELHKTSAEHDATVARADRVRHARDEFMKSCERTAKALAADRGTKILPVTVALVLFIATFIVAFIRISQAGPSNPAVLLNIEAYSISFSMPYFWLISTVILGATVGSSQTEFAIPRILSRLQREVQGVLTPENSADSKHEGSLRVQLFRKIKENEESANSWDREMNGGVYSWQPAKWAKLPYPLGTSESLQFIRAGTESSFSVSQSNPEHQEYSVISDDEHATKAQTMLETLNVPQSKAASISSFGSATSDGILPTSVSLEAGQEPQVAQNAKKSIPAWRLWGERAWHMTKKACILTPGSWVFPLVIVLVPVLFAWLIAMLAPPQGFVSWHCRPWGETWLFIAWASAWWLDHCRIDLIKPHSRSYKMAFFVFQLAKDGLATAATFYVIWLTQRGIFNRCDCYTNKGGGYIVMPHSEPFASHLFNGIWKDNLVAVLFSVFFQLILVPALVLWRYSDAWRVFVQRDDGRSYAQKYRLDRLPKRKNRQWPSWSSPWPPSSCDTDTTISGNLQAVGVWISSYESSLLLTSTLKT